MLQQVSISDGHSVCPGVRAAPVRTGIPGVMFGGPIPERSNSYGLSLAEHRAIPGDHWAVDFVAKVPQSLDNRPRYTILHRHKTAVIPESRIGVQVPYYRNMYVSRIASRYLCMHVVIAGICWVYNCMIVRGDYSRSP